MAESEIPGRVTVYNPTMAAEAAEMFNAFSALWPGGFGGGASYDERRVRDWLDETSAVADLIALDAEGIPVGYCGIYPHYRDADACYVTILGIVPRVKGGKFGKRLLLRAVELAIQEGYTRLDLNTWPGNLDAVPLYKKTGLFWVPETSVTMQNYLPALARNPLAEAWFERHPDWYNAFRRELTQAPDEEYVDGMAVYTYRFTASGEGKQEDELVGWVDRFGWGLCGVSATLNGERLAVRTQLNNQAILIGIDNAMTISIENGSDREVEVALTVAPFDGLGWSNPFPEALIVAPGETTSVSRAFVVSKAARCYKSGERSEVIRTHVVLDGRPMTLVTGGEIRPAVEVRDREPYHIVPPGGEPVLHLDLINHAQVPIRGAVSSFVTAAGRSPASAGDRPFALNASEVAGVSVPIAGPLDSVTASEGGPSPTYVYIHATMEREGQAYSMPAVRIPMVLDLPELVAIVERGRDAGVVEPTTPVDVEDVHLLTDRVDIHAHLQGGQFRSIGRRTLPDLCWPANFQVGPPFGMGPDSSLLYDTEIQRDGDALTLVLVGDSRQFPGLRIRKHARTRPGVSEIEIWVTLTALDSPSEAGSGEAPTSAGGRFSVSSYDGLSLNPYAGIARSFTPVARVPPEEGATEVRIVSCDAQLSLMQDAVVPQASEQWPETWTAVESLMRGDLSAWFWRPDGIAKVKVSNGFLATLESTPRTLAPGETIELVHAWYGFGYGSLAEVRQRYQQLVGRQEVTWDDLHIDGTTERPVEVRWIDPAPLPAGQRARRTLVFDFAVPVALRGDLTLQLPTGWEAGFVTPEGLAASHPMPAPETTTRVLLAVELLAPPTTSGVGVITLAYQGAYEISFKLPLLVVAEGCVSVASYELAGRPVIHVDNGALRFDVVADRGGNLIHLEDAAGHAYLHDVFPECRPYLFITHYVGGAQPVVYVPGEDQLFLPPEPVETTFVDEGIWRGVRATWTVQQETQLRAETFAVTYLAAPGLGIIRMRISRIGATKRRYHWVGGLIVVVDAALPQAAGRVFTIPGATQIWRRHPRQDDPTHQAFVGPLLPSQPWTWLELGERALGFLGTGGPTSAPTAFDLGDFVGAFLIGSRETGGTGPDAVEFALIVNRPQAEAEALIEAL